MPLREYQTNYRLMLELSMAEQFSVVMVVSIVPPATSSSCSSLICSGLLVSSLIVVGFGFWLFWFEDRIRWSASIRPITG